MRSYKSIVIFFVCLSLLFVMDVSAAPKRKDMKKDPPDLLAKMGDKTITKREFDARIMGLPVDLQNRIKTEQQKIVYLDSLVQAELLALEAQSQRIDRETAIAVRIDDLTTNLLAQEYMRRQWAKLPAISDQEIEKYYDEHKTEIATPPMVRAQHILIRVDAKAKQEEFNAAYAKINGIRNKAVKGEDFGKLAEQYSEDTTTKTKGGDIGFFTRDRIIPELSQQAFNMNVGEISQPVKTALGYHLIKVNDKTAAKQLTLQEASPRIRAFLENSRQQEALRKEINRLKNKYHLVEYPEKLK